MHTDNPKRWRKIKGPSGLWYSIREVWIGLGISLGIVAVPSLVCGCVVALFIGAAITRQPGTFCSTNDAEYRRIMENHDIWLDHFSSFDFPIFHEGYDVVELADGSKIAIGAYYDGPYDPQIFYFSTESGWPGTPIGIAGYIYTVSGSLPDWGDMEYKQLDENVYCYRDRDTRIRFAGS